jgi:hypothetical protein
MIIPHDALMTARWNQADSGFPAIQNLDNLTIGHLLLNQRPVRFHFANGDCFHTKSIFYVLQYVKQDFYELRFFNAIHPQIAQIFADGGNQEVAFKKSAPSASSADQKNAACPSDGRLMLVSSKSTRIC